VKRLIIEADERTIEKVMIGEIKLPGKVVGIISPLRECKNDRCNNLFENNGKRLYCSPACSNRQAYRDWEARQKQKQKKEERRKARKGKKTA